MADFTTPHRYLETILSGPMDGRRKLYSRLGMAARDPIDELLGSALEFEHQEIASLDRFIAWFARGEVEIKRDPSAPMNAVRVMTVHGAKGLEAPVVILADATADPARLGGVSRTLDFPVPDAGTVPLIRPRKAERMSPFLELIEAEEVRDLEEHWRLLYVGLTRAEERLVIAGLQPKTKDGVRPENCWHTRVERALVSLGAQPEADPAWGEILRYKGNVPAGPVKAKAAADRPGAPSDPGLGHDRRTARGAAAAAARAFGHCGGHRGRSAAEREPASRGRTRDLDPPAAGAPCAGREPPKGTRPRFAGSNAPPG